VTTGTTS
jgi:hypothetical protein